MLGPCRMLGLHEAKPRYGAEAATIGRATGSHYCSVRQASPVDSAGKKLAVDIYSNTSLCRVGETHMEVEDLIERLCVTVGMIMEDASLGAISTRCDIRQRGANLHRASKEISALVDAASALVERLA